MKQHCLLRTNETVRLNKNESGGNKELCLKNGGRVERRFCAKKRVNEFIKYVINKHRASLKFTTLFFQKKPWNLRTFKKNNGNKSYHHF